MPSWSSEPAQHIARTFFGWIYIQRDRTPQEEDWRDGRLARPSGGDARRSIHKTTDVSASLFLDSEIIGHRENIGNAFGLHLGNLFVHLTSDHTFQCELRETMRRGQFTSGLSLNSFSD
jgi:hypothetical protein